MILSGRPPNSRQGYAAAVFLLLYHETGMKSRNDLRDMKKAGKTQNPDQKDDDAAVWRKVADTVRPYGAARKAALKAPAGTATGETKAAASRPAAKRATEKQKLTPDIRLRPSKESALTEARMAASALDQGASDDLRRKKWPIDRKIDLHGLRQQEAEAVLARFILSCVKAEKRTVLVITGKGNAATGGGVIRRMLPVWLQETALRQHILAFTPARPEDGGTGAFYIRLRKNKNPRR